jgi:hypothetical protein
MNMDGFKVKIDGIEELKGKLDMFERSQLPYAMARALTKTAQDVKSAEITEMKNVFDRPTPYTLNSLYLRPATKTNHTALVWLKDDAGKGTPAAEYLLPEIVGGNREMKRFERALQATGVMPKGMFAVPGAAADIDAYGNMSCGQIRQILSYFKSAEMTAGYTANMTPEKKKRLAKGTKRRRGFTYFVSNGSGRTVLGLIEDKFINPTAHLPMGIYKRVGFAWGSALKPIVMFVKNAPSYSPRFKFFEVGQRVVNEKFQANFAQAMDEALKTARLK